MDAFLTSSKGGKPHVHAMMVTAREELLAQIHDLEENKSRDSYTSRANSLISAYEKILTTAIKKSFMKRKVAPNSEALEKKREIVREYLELARECTDIDLPVPEQAQQRTGISCNVCDNQTWFTVTDEHIFTCQSCFSQQTLLRNTPSWNDIGRANGGQKYVYDRRVHFRDSMLQYQGKQNCTIPQKVYDDLRHHLEIHRALEGKEGDPKEYRYKNVTKKLLRDFLSELGHNKQYENIHLIHYVLTGQKPDDISHLEDTLMQEFDQLTAVYDEDFKHLDRKSIVSTQCCLYLLLKKHDHPCKRSDFNILKTPERRCDHDDILRHCFSKLGWTYFSLL